MVNIGHALPRRVATATITRLPKAGCIADESTSVGKTKVLAMERRTNNYSCLWILSAMVWAPGGSS